MLKFLKKTFIVFITTKLRHIEKSPKDRMHEQNSLGKKIDNSRFENWFRLVSCTK